MSLLLPLLPAALMAAADATTGLKVGTFVFANDYKQPVVLAKEVATIDVLSGGRVEFGIGAGSMNTDYEQSGIPHDRAGVRTDRLAESLAVCKAIFAGGTVDFTGEHYDVTGYRGSPRPVQTPHPPILIGGGGRRLLTLAAQQADIVGINPKIASGQTPSQRNGSRSTPWMRASSSSTASMPDQEPPATG